MAFAMALAVGWCLLAALTALGGRHRGNPVALVLVSGLLFPATWIAWYVRDVLLRTCRR